MHLPKEFLLLECESVRSVLQETLRHQYGVEGSREFFEECEVRLNYIKQEIDSCGPNDHDGLSNNAALLIQLSELIARIERSAIGEFSWPFAEELKEIAVAICTEATLANPHTPPKVHVLSDGGLDKYAIDVEPKRPAAGKRRILTIIFPRSFKHLVLLHPVLGHEVGHAIWRGSEHEKTLKGIIQTKLLAANAKFASPTTTAAWIYSGHAPSDVKGTLTKLAQQYGIDQNNFFGAFASWPAWVEELTCDLIGIATFGPSFVAALWQLLSCLTPSGGGFSQAHPPSGVRINLMLAAVRVLGFEKCVLQDPDAQLAHDNFWSALKLQQQTNGWFDVFSDAELLATLNDIRAWLTPYKPVLYSSPSPDLLAKLYRQAANQVPPVGFEMQADGTPRCNHVDFRHILYAGWIASHSATNISFYDMNRLCEHAIMQQRAIRLHLG